jgi:hypothetical protein
VGLESQALKTLENRFGVRLSVFDILTADNAAEQMADSPVIQKRQVAPRGGGNAEP